MSHFFIETINYFAISIVIVRQQFESTRKIKYCNIPSILPNSTVSRHVDDCLGNIDSFLRTLSFECRSETLIVTLFKTLASFKIYFMNSTSCSNSSNPLKLKVVRCDDKQQGPSGGSIQHN